MSTSTTHTRAHHTTQRAMRLHGQRALRRSERRVLRGALFQTTYRRRTRRRGVAASPLGMGLRLVGFGVQCVVLAAVPFGLGALVHQTVRIAAAHPFAIALGQGKLPPLYR